MDLAAGLLVVLGGDENSAYSVRGEKAAMIQPPNLLVKNIHQKTTGIFQLLTYVLGAWTDELEKNTVLMGPKHGCQHLAVPFRFPFTHGLEISPEPA